MYIGKDVRLHFKLEDALCLKHLISATKERISITFSLREQCSDKRVKIF